jgi:hypothetical protein
MVGSLGSGGQRIPRRVDPRPLEAVPALRIYALHHAGALVGGATTRWQLANYIITVRCEGSHIFLSFEGGDEIAVQIDRFPLFLGGDRPYFVCPGCSRRTWDLYLKGCVRCRRCCNLDYSCRHDHRWGPAVQQAAKLRARLFSNSSLTNRRRRRILALLSDYEAKAKAVLGDTIAALERRKGTRK